ncbi:MAG TPA: peptidylprolyl isomerase [Candidatus Binatia bacterium]|jgi:FKBP-type peptidyl-prolyl cis-trans isomerase 2|nr:peptidylprolyl isomerase [Candidatus Binatia bacterium]
MEVAEGRVVTLEYTVRLARGDLVDSTGGCGPIAILYGAGQLFPALEARIAGMQPGETRELEIPAEEAYGPSRPELVRTLPRDRLPPDLELVVGQEYRLKSTDGRQLRFRLLAVGEHEVRADFNHPSAGQALRATVTVVAVRPATPEEERRGRV